MSKEREPLKYSGIFFDSPDLVFFEQWYETGILGGATLNPPSLKKAGVTNVEEHFKKMVGIVEKPFPISVEIPDTNWPEEKMVELGIKYHEAFPENAVIKVPMDPSDPLKAFKVIKELGQNHVRTNATLGLTAGQLISASEAGRFSNANGDNYVSLFWGRREEAKLELITKEEAIVDTNPPNNSYYEKDYKKQMARLLRTDLIADASQTLTTTLEYLRMHNLDTKIIVGSIRRPYQIERAFGLGADIVTIPPEILSEWMRTKRGEDTTKEFNTAYRSVRNQMVLIEGYNPPN